jgi:hypothetical protein
MTTIAYSSQCYAFVLADTKATDTIMIKILAILLVLVAMPSLSVRSIGHETRSAVEVQAGFIEIESMQCSLFGEGYPVKGLEFHGISSMDVRAS